MLLSSVPPTNSLLSVSDHWSAFWADTVPWRTLDFLSSSWTTEKRAHCQVWRAWLGGPRTPSRTTYTNLDFVFVEKALVFIDPKIWGACSFLDPPGFESRDQKIMKLGWSLYGSLFLGRLHTHSRATLCELWEDIMWCLPPAVISMCCFCLLLLPLIHKFIHCMSNVYAFTDQHFHLDCFLWS